MSKDIGFFTLNNNVRIPKIGFGTYKAAENGDESVIKEAIRQGYTLFDTASFYENEAIVGSAVKKSGLPRDHFFLTSKLWKTQMGYQNTLQAFNDSCKQLKTDYLDLYLIHWPRPDLVCDWKKIVVETWKALEELYDEKKVRAIGVSNFLPHHLDVILNSCKIMPAVDQIEFHPGYTQTETVNFCRSLRIQVEAWSPIGRARLIDNPLLKEIAAKYNKSVPQLCIRFSLQNNVLPLPKASSPERMAQNLDVFDFEISEEDMEKIMAMPVTGWSGEHPDAEPVVI